MIKIAVCDDDERELSRLLTLLSEYRQARGCDFACKGFGNGVDLLSDIKSGEYSAVLLDVLMPGLNGIQTAREIREIDKNVKLLFLTSSPEFAVESYEVRAFHYLLKPTKKDTLFPLLDRILSDAESPDTARLTLKTKTGLTSIQFARLEYVEVLSKTVGFHLTDGSVIETSGTLSAFEEELLMRPEFSKIHRSFLVNLGQVETLERGEIITRQNHHIPMSRSLRTQVKEEYLQFLLTLRQNKAESPNLTSTPSQDERESKGVYRILLVDDELDALVQWTNVLKRKGCITDRAQNAAEALVLVKSYRYDCVLLDVRLSGESSFSFCRSLREVTDVPIVFLSALGDLDTQLQGFLSGGVDYITKDTPAELFWAKVETRIRFSSSDRTKLCFGPLTLDLTSRGVVLEEHELILTPTEFDLLWLLAEHAEQVYAPDAIYNAIWGGERQSDDQTVQVHMSRLRRKLEKAYPNHFFIETVWGEGYRFMPAETAFIV